MRFSGSCAPAPRDLPPDYGDGKNTHRRFSRWRDKGIWEALLERLVDEPDCEWLLMDASYIKVHPHAAGAKGGNQTMSRTKAQHEAAFSRGCAGSAGPNVYYRRYHSGLQPG